jgi:hypothetical protein
MKRIYLLAIPIIVAAVGFTVGYVVYAASVNNPWYKLSCEEMFEYAMSPEHQDLTMEEHMEFHKSYEPCLQQ